MAIRLMGPATGGPLAGRRVVVTRAAAQAVELIGRLRSVGADVCVAPLIDIADPADGGRALSSALERLDDYEWIVVTSPNGARRVAAGLRAAHRRPNVAAVGAATAAALGPDAHVDLVPSRQSGAALVEEFPLRIVGSARGRVLLAQAEQASSTVVDGLVSKGWDVDRVVTYRTTPVRPTATVSSDVLAADAVLFASGSAVRSWVEAYGPSTPRVVIAIGPATAAVADRLGLKVDAVAADHSLGGLVSCLLTQLGESD